MQFIPEFLLLLNCVTTLVTHYYVVMCVFTTMFLILCSKYCCDGQLLGKTIA